MPHHRRTSFSFPPAATILPTTSRPASGRNRRAANAAPECRRQRPPPKCCSSAATAKWLAAAKVRPRAVAPSRPWLRRHAAHRRATESTPANGSRPRGARRASNHRRGMPRPCPPNKLRRGLAPAWHCPTPHPAQPTGTAAAPTPPTPRPAGPAPARPATSRPARAAP